MRPGQREPSVSPVTSLVANGVSRIPGGLRSLARHGTHLAGEAVSVLTGGSPAAPAKADKRFRDPTFADNPVYRTVMQLYLVWCAEVSSAVEEADLNWRDKELVRFVTGVITSSAAPTNVLLGNPAALKRAFETGGASLVLGMRNRLHDLRHNAGAPSQNKRGALRVGEELAVTPGAVVYRDDVCEVLQYRPTTDTIRERPVLLVPPQIGRYYFMDLAPGRSFVEHAVAQGIPFFLVSWKDPGPDQREWNLDVYAASLLQVIDAVREISGSDDVNLLGLCAGGILTSIILAHLAETGDERVRSAAFGVTLLDFDEPTPIGMFNQGPIVRQARRRSSGAGTLDPRSLATVFNWMRPNDLVWNYWVNNYLLGQDPPVFDILAWNADGTSLPAALHHQFLKLFNLNLLAKGELHVLGHRIDLAKVTIDTYATGATTDHLTPWKGCYRTARLMSGTTTFVLSNAGHIASLVNPPGNPKAHYFTGPEPGEDPEEWRAQATEVRGTWWEH
ncbi:MAG: alpha/beta fold hydrolase, partial [Solirubrobacterales bacterium]|nr:alpha/beta fold hydrolase [Solirubrobacterales bacterium]